MAYDTKTFDAANLAAFNHVRKGTPIEQAWADVVKIVRRGVGPKTAKAAGEIPLTESLAAVASEYAFLLARDRPGKNVKGLWFGLVEMGGEGDSTLWMPYIAGARRFDPKDPDWPVGPAWMADDCYASNAAMQQLSALRSPNDHDKAWLVETALIQPLHALMVGAFVRNASSACVLGPAASRGIGYGFDDGDHFTLGTVDKKGFAPARKWA